MQKQTQDFWLNHQHQLNWIKDQTSHSWPTSNCWSCGEVLPGVSLFPGRFWRRRACQLSVWCHSEGGDKPGGEWYLLTNPVENKIIFCCFWQRAEEENLTHLASPTTPLDAGENDSQISERKCCRRFIRFIDEVEICWYLRECWAVDFARQQKFFFQMQDLLQNKSNNFWHLPTSKYFVIFLSLSLCFTFGVAIWPGPSFWASCCIASWNYCRWNIVIGLVHFFSSPELSLFAHPPGQCRPLPLNRDELELEMHITMVFGLGCIGSLCCL